MSAYVWFSEELWPGGYNFFVMLRNNPAVRRIFDSDVYSIPKENLSKPQKIVVTQGEMRNVYYHSDPSFEKINKGISAFISATLKDETLILNRTTVDKNEWHDVLRNDEILDTNSIYVNYSIEYGSNLFARVIGIKETWLGKEISAVKEFIVAPVDGGNILFYVKDAATEMIYKYLVKYEESKTVASVINDYATNTDTTYSYSYELNLDKNDEGIGTGVVQKVFLDSMSIISSGTTTVPVIYGENPFETGIVDRDELLGGFQYASGSPNHHTDFEGIEYFIENYSHLKIYPSGLIEYVAETAGGGISLPESPATAYEALNKSIEFAENIWRSAMGDVSFSVLVTSDIIENNEGNYKFTLDYYYEGNMVTTSLKGNGHDSMNHAVEIEVKNGEIVKYRHFFRKYDNAGTVVSTPQIEALDKIYERFQSPETEIIINDIYLSYIENGSINDKSPVWCAKIEGSDEIVY